MGSGNNGQIGTPFFLKQQADPLSQKQSCKEKGPGAECFYLPFVNGHDRLQESLNILVIRIDLQRVNPLHHHVRQV